VALATAALDALALIKTPGKAVLYAGVKVGWNAPEHSSGAHQFGHKRSGAQTCEISWPEHTFHRTQQLGLG